MRFLIDAQLPPSLAKWLTSSGWDALHVGDAGLLYADDSAIWEFSLSRKLVIVTKDEDFAHRFRQGAAAPAVLWLRVGNTSRRALVEWLEPLWPEVVNLLESGERLIEVR